LQDPTAPIVPPYDRLPQLSSRYQRSDLGPGLDLQVDADFTRFRSDRLQTGQPNADRAFLALQVARPWQLPGGFLTPKLLLHATGYQFDAPLADGATTASRLVPTLSLDSGLVFERDTELLGRSLRQTLEPRAFYVNTPYRDQSLLPNYDWGPTTSVCHHLHRERLCRQRPNCRQQPADAGRDQPLARSRHGCRGGPVRRGANACASKTRTSPCRVGAAVADRLQRPAAGRQHQLGRPLGL
jgi:hypothetical protein